MRQFYKLVLSTITAMLVGYGAFAQCPPFDITVGATEVSGSDFVCDGTNVTVQWNDVPGATGYRLRVGNNASYDNLDVSYVVDGGGAGPFQSTFSVPAATNGTFYTYTVDYSMDAGFSLGTAAGASYTDCSANAETFKVSLDPTNPTDATLTDGDDGTTNTVCINTTFEVTVNGGSLGDLGAYYFKTFGGAATNTFYKVGKNAAVNVLADPDTFNVVGNYDLNVAIADSFCGVNYPVTAEADLDNGGLIVIRDIYQIDGVSTTDEGAITNGQKVCFDGSGTDLFTITYSDVLGTGTAGTINTSTDSGSTFTPGAAAPSPHTATIGADDTDYAFYISDAAYCQATNDTFFASTFDNYNLGASFTGFTANGTNITGGETVNVCIGQLLAVDVNGLISSLGDAESNEIRIRNATTGNGLTSWISVEDLIDDSSGVIRYVPILAESGHNVRVQVRDCAGNATMGAIFIQNVYAAATEGTTSEFSLLREDNLTSIASGDKVCSGEFLDLTVVIGDGSLSATGVLKIWKTTDAGATYTMVGMGASPLNVVDHAHGTVSATYVAAIVSDCDSVPVAINESVNVNVFTTSGNLTSFAIAEASLADDLACNSESITLQATPTTLGDDSPVVEFFTSVDNDPLTLGDNVSLGNGVFNVGVSAYELNINFGNSPVYYFAELTSECNSSTSPLSNQISNHDETVTAPTAFDISEVAALGTDLGDGVLNPNSLICSGTTVYYTTDDGDLLTSDDGSAFYWEIDTTSNGAGTGYVGLDTTINGESVSALINDDNALIRVRIAGGCQAPTAWVVSQINLKSSSADINVSSANAEIDFINNLNPEYLVDFDDVTNVGLDSICSSEDIAFNFDPFDLSAANDNPRVIGYQDGVFAGSIPVNADNSGGYTIGWSGPSVGVYELRFVRDCEDTLQLATFTLDSYLDDNVQDAALDARLADAGNNGTAIADNQPVCPGTEVTFYNDGTLGEATNGRTVAEYVFVYDDGSGPVTVFNGSDSTLTLTVNSTTTVESYISGGCNPAMAPTTATFTVNVIASQNNFTSISLTQDNYCADEATSLPVTLTANGAALVFDDTTRVVWYSMNDAGDPVSKIKTTYAGTPGAGQLLFNGGDGFAPDTTTTIGVRLEGCDTTAFEVRTITVKDLPQNQSASGVPAVVSASPNAVCAGSSSTLNIINYIIGANGQVTWYDDMAGTTLLGTGPSYTAANITSDTTFYVRIEADCDTTAMLSVNVNLSTVDPTDVTDLDVPAFMCEGDNIVVTASGSTGDGSYIWEVSFDGVVYSSISDGSPGDNMLSYSANNLSYTNGVTNVTLRASRTNGCVTTTPYGETFEVRQKPDDLTSINPTATEACVNSAAIDIVVAGGAAGFDGAIEWTIEKTGGVDSVVTAWAGMNMVSFDWASFDGSGEYTISAYYVSGSCGSFIGTPVSTVINVYELPMNDYPNGGDTSVCANSMLDLSVLSSYTALNQSFSFSGPGVTGNMYDAAAGSFANSAGGGVESLSYMVTENGCSQTFTVEVEVYGIPTITSATTTAASCNTADGTVKITGISGGTAPFEFEADGGIYGFGADSTITGLAGGSHIITAMDDNGCISADYSITIESSTGFSVTGTIDNDISCNGEEDGEFSILVAGGLLPYDYTVTKDGQPFTSGDDLTATDYTFSDLGPGVYVATFMDDAGCTQSFTATLDDPGLIGLTVDDPQDVLCNGDATGSFGGLVATSSNGGPFEYSLNGGAFTTNNIFDNLVAGDYTITVKDGNGCERSFLFPIEEPTVLTIDTNVLAFDAQGYDVEIDAAGGVAPYTYSKGGAFQTSNLFEDLDPGNYTFTVKDDNDCETEIDVFLAPVGIKENTGVFAQSTSHPNPFTNEFTITGVPNDVEIAVFDIYGKRVDFVSVIKNGKATITASNLASGVYFATVRKGADVATFRMVKN